MKLKHMDVLIIEGEIL